MSRALPCGDYGITVAGRLVAAAADVLRVGYRTVVAARKAPDGQLVALCVYTGEVGAMPPL